MTVQQQLDEFEHKRRLVSSLIRLAQEYNNHTQSLRNCWLLSRPSQKYPSKINEYESAIFDKMSLQDMQAFSQSCDRKCVELLDSLLKVVELKLDAKQMAEPPGMSDKVKVKLSSLSDASRKAVILKVMLQAQGVVIHAVKFNVPPDIIGEQIEELIEVNKVFRSSMIQRLGDLIEHVSELISMESLAENIRNKLRYLGHLLSQNMAHLMAKGDLTELPNDLDALSLEEVRQDDVDAFIQATKNSAQHIFTDEKTATDTISAVKHSANGSNETTAADNTNHQPSSSSTQASEHSGGQQPESLQKQQISKPAASKKQGFIERCIQKIRGSKKLR